MKKKKEEEQKRKELRRLAKQRNEKQGLGRNQTKLRGQEKYKRNVIKEKLKQQCQR